MHPAPSLIIFTTLSGMGFGLIAFLGLGLVPAGPGTMFLGAFIAAALTGGGLLSSVFHLGHPERAWRALSQWRSSWLSREGVLSIATLAAFGVFAGGWVFFGWWLWPVGLVAAALAVASVYSTAMIYGSLRAVPAWHDPLTPAVYLAFALAGGALLAALLARVTGQTSAPLEVVAALALAGAGGLKALWWARAVPRGFADSGAGTATGLGGIGTVRPFEPPHTTPNYLMREMIFRVGRRHAVKLRVVALVLGAAVPLVAVVGSLAVGGAWPLLLVGAVSHVAGVLAARWLFFAEARHVVSLYYEDQTQRGGGPARRPA